MELQIKQLELEIKKLELELELQKNNGNFINIPYQIPYQPFNPNLPCPNLPYLPYRDLNIVWC